MLKERSGPGGPDHVAEPREIVAPDATSIHVKRSVDHAQPGADVPWWEPIPVLALRLRVRWSTTPAGKTAPA